MFHFAVRSPIGTTSEKSLREEVLADRFEDRVGARRDSWPTASKLVSMGKLCAIGGLASAAWIAVAGLATLLR